MSSMTTTLTPGQAQAGALHGRIAVPTTCYWDNLKEVDRLRSINAQKFRKLGRKTGWFPAGVVLKKWTEEIYPTITRIINDRGNYERIFGKHNKEVTQPCWLYMVGEGQQWMTARPTIVAICSKTQIAQRICDLLQNIPSLRTWNLGFDYMHHKEKIRLLTGTKDANDPSNLSGSLCGVQAFASTFPASLSAKWKPTTVGGILKINQDYYCLSVAHAFHLDSSVVGDSGSDSSPDSDDSSDESTDFYTAPDLYSAVSVLACPSDVLENVNLGLYLDCGPISTSAHAPARDHSGTPLNADNTRLIGSGRVRQETASGMPSLLLCCELDWVLVRVNDPEFVRRNLVQAPSGVMLCPKGVSEAPPNGKVLVAAGVSGVFESNCQGIIGGLALPGSFQMIDVWTIESVCLPGDSGSWVIDPVTGSMYGMIIATAPEAQESYMIPARQIYDSIKSKLPTGTAVLFPTTDATPVDRHVRSTPRQLESSVLAIEKRNQYSASPLHSRPSARSNSKTTFPFLEWYSFDRRGEDWSVADRHMIRVAQAEIKKRLDHRKGEFFDMNAMNNLRREQINQLMWRRKVFWEMIPYMRPVAASIKMVETRKSTEKHRDGRKVVEVLSFDIIISFSAPRSPLIIHLRSHWLADDISKVRLPVAVDEKDEDIGRQLPLRRIDRGSSEEQQNWHPEGQMDDPFGQERLFTSEGKPIFPQTSTMILPPPARFLQSSQSGGAIEREGPMRSRPEAVISSTSSTVRRRDSFSKLSSHEKSLSLVKPTANLSKERALNDGSDFLSERGIKVWRSIDVTEIPRRLLSTQVLDELVNPFHEEGDHIIIERAFEVEQIERLLKRSKAHKDYGSEIPSADLVVWESADARLREDTEKALELSRLPAPNEMTVTAGRSNPGSQSKDSGYETSSRSTVSKPSSALDAHGGDDSWNTESYAEFIKLSASKPRHQQLHGDERGEREPVVQYPPSRTTSSSYYRDYPRFTNHDLDAGPRVPSRHYDSVISYPPSGTRSSQVYYEPRRYRTSEEREADSRIPSRRDAYRSAEYAHARVAANQHDSQPWPRRPIIPAAVPWPMSFHAGAPIGDEPLSSHASGWFLPPPIPQSSRRNSIEAEDESQKGQVGETDGDIPLEEYMSGY